MAISRITTWADGQALTAGDLNAEFNNILNNALTLISPLTGSLDFNNIAPSNFRVPSQAGFSTSIQPGLLYLSSGDNLLAAVGSDGIGFTVGPATGLSRVQGLTGSLVSNIGSFAAQGYQLKRAGGFLQTITATSSFNINTQTAGPIANGRDQAAAFASSDIHFYAISTGTRSTSIAGVASSTPPPTGPTLPTNYGLWTYLCSMKYNTATSAVFIPAYVQGAEVYFLNPQSLISIATTQASVSTTPSPLTSSRIPSIASHLIADVTSYGGRGSTAGSTLDLSFEVGFGPGSLYIAKRTEVLTTGVTYFETVPQARIPITSTVGIDGMTATMTIVNGHLGIFNLRAKGFIVPNGDNA